MAGEEDELRGAYGIAVAGLETQDRLLVPAGAGWPEVRIAFDRAAPDGDRLLLDEHCARYPHPSAGHVTVDRRAAAVCFHGDGPLSPEEILHPHLGMVAAVYAQWLPERIAFHAGAFVREGGAVAVVGNQGDGKSTLMAALAMAGVAVIGDDTLVLERLHCLPGVRCVDLRPDAASALGIAASGAATVRGGLRRRLPLEGPAASGPLSGWIFLSWADELAVRELPPHERIARIAASQGWHRRGVTDAGALLDLAALPAWELARPRDWRQLPRVVERVRELGR